MIRLARKLLDALLEAAYSDNNEPPPECASVLEACIDAAEVAIADDYEPPPVVVDTREQRPFAPYLWQKGKREYLPPERQCLEEGDYTTPTLRDHVRIERKSIPDLYGSLFGSTIDASGEKRANQDRLREEFLRLQQYPRAYFVVEGDASDLVDYIIDNRRGADPVAAVNCIEKMGFDYDIPIKWHSSWKRWRDESGVRRSEWNPMYARERAEMFVGSILSWGHAQATNKTDAKKARKRGLTLPWLLSNEKHT